MREAASKYLRPYVAFVTGTGLVTFALAAGFFVSGRDPADHLVDAVLAIVVIASELRPIRFRRGDEEEEITVSSTFAFAILLRSGLAPAVIALAAASLIGDLIRHKPAWKAGFNVGQYTLSMAFAAVPLALFGHHGMLQGIGSLAGPQLLNQLGIALAGAVVFFVTNNVLAGAAVAMAQRQDILSFLKADLGFQAATTLGLLALSPIVVRLSDLGSREELIFIVLLTIPLVAVKRGGQAAVEKEHQSVHDPLTQLPNRVLFLDRLTHAITQAERKSDAVAVVMLDLNRFKEVNDALGHEAGDELLKLVAARLSGTVRQVDSLARLGADEFGMILEATDVPGARTVASKINACLLAPFDLPQMKLETGAAIGIAVYPKNGSDAEEVVKNAEIAMYLAKRNGTPCEVYSSGTDQSSPRRLTLISDLRGSIEERRMYLKYQPKANLITGVINGVEALVRWDHPEHGPVSPEEFIPFVETSGLMGAMTDFVLDEALHQCRRWLDNGTRLQVAVNLASQSLHDVAFPDFIEGQLARYNLDPDMLLLEITESTVMTDPETVRTVLMELSKRGVRLALDDFGTGYSSLSYLSALPVDELKIDKGFVMDMSDNGNHGVIVKSTIDLARNLGLKVVAEGVETATTWDQLLDLGCDQAQGYYLSPPVAPGKIDLTAVSGAKLSSLSVQEVRSQERLSSL